MASETKVTAIIYDFDGTLSHGNLHEHSFLPTIKVPTREFWAEVKQDAKEHDGDEILSFMRLTLDKAKANNHPITKGTLRAHGQKARLFEGVTAWFERINDHAGARNLKLEHYIISSGLLEMIRGCSIATNFKNIFASHYAYDEHGVALWPAVAVNYTTKMQYLFRINKGIDNHWDNDAINKWMPMKERPIPFERMIFIGDGETDIPTMKTVQELEGTSVAVFDPEKWGTQKTRDLAYRLIAEDRVHFVAPADYTETSQLDVTIKGILGRIAREAGYRGD